MDNIWSFREIYDKARQIKESQDSFCARALEDDWDGLGAFPEELQYEALVDVLRGRVKVQVHCYETVDLDDIVRVRISQPCIATSVNALRSSSQTSSNSL